MKKVTKTVKSTVAIVLVVVIGVITILALINFNSKKDFLPFDVKKDDILKIELYKQDSYDVLNKKPVGEATVTLNEEDTEKAIRDLSKLSQTKKISDVEMNGNNVVTKLIVYTKEGKVTLSPIGIDDNKNVYVTFSTVEFYDKLENPEAENSLTVERIGKNISKDSLLNKNTILKTIEEYKNGTRK